MGTKKSGKAAGKPAAVKQNRAYNRTVKANAVTRTKRGGRKF